MTKKLFLLAFLVSCIFAYACQEGDRVPPGRISDLTFFTDPNALSFTDHMILGAEAFPAKTYALAFTATGDNHDQGSATLYDLRYLTSDEIAIDGLNPNSICDRNGGYLHHYLGEPVPQKAGKPEIIGLAEHGFARGQTYHFCLWAIDKIGQVGKPGHAAGQIPFLGVGLRSPGSDLPGLGLAAENLGLFSGNSVEDAALSSPAKGEVMVYFGRFEKDLFIVAKLFGHDLRRVGDLYPDLQINGDSTWAFGSAISNVQDVNKDNSRDLAIGAPDAPAGKVFLFNGTARGTIDASQAWSVIDGELAGDSLGAKIVSCGDMNGDLSPDFAVAAPGAGKVYLVMGNGSAVGSIPASGSIADIASVVIKGNPAYGFGASIECGQDINGDGVPDLLIGAPAADNGSGPITGAVYVFLGGTAGLNNFHVLARNLALNIDLTAAGKADMVINGETDGQKFGQSIANLGIVVSRTTDTTRDFAIGAPGIGTGKVYVFYGGPSGNLHLNSFTPPATVTASEADLIIPGITGEIIGEQLSGLADLNNDGHFDLAASNGLGGIRIYYLVPGIAPSSLATALFQTSFPFSSFALIEDYDGKNLGDILIGAGGIGRGFLLK